MAPASPETRSLARVSAGEPLPLLFFADGYRFPDVYHTTRLLTPDPIIALEEVEELVVVASSLEEGRARAESRATQVRNAALAQHRQ